VQRWGRERTGFLGLGDQALREVRSWGESPTGEELPDEGTRCRDNVHPQKGGHYSGKKEGADQGKKYMTEQPNERRKKKDRMLNRKGICGREEAE